MVRIVIAGSGFGGLTVALQLKKRLKNTNHRITVIAKDNQFVYRPNLILVALGKKSPKSITFNLATLYAKSGVEFLKTTIESIDAEAKTVNTATGAVLYDKMIVALGEKLHYEEIPGLREYGYNVCSIDGALALRSALEHFDGGPIVVGWSQFVQTGGPAFEVALELEQWLKHHDLSGSIQFIDPLPKLWAPAGPEAGEFMTSLFAERKISRMGPVQVKEVKSDRVILKDGTELPSKLTVVTPPFHGEDAQSALANGQSRGWLETGKDMRSVHYPDVYAVGSAVAFEGPKQAHTAMLQAETAAHNLALEINQSTAPRKEYDHEMSCVLDLGNGQGLFVRRSLWNDQHQVVRIGRKWPMAKSALAYSFIHTPIFKKWGVPMSKINP
ncbi:MAG: FAD-dependent oxidoreductase [Firmicutes bacterium]|nr:FAD-dependent oxidoreductase [Bacillota bacterium]